MEPVTNLPSDTRPGRPERANGGSGSGRESGSGGGSESGAGALERRRGAELTPAERKVRRRNRQWFLVIAIPAAVLGVAALAASIIADQSTPSVKPVSVPAGYKAVSDGVFAYAVPAVWTTNDLYTDDAGDLDTSGQTGWVAEHVDARPGPPVAGETPPEAFRAFGVNAPSPYQISGGQPTQVPGAAVAFRYQVSRPGGFQATAIDAWQSSSGAEIWLLVNAPPATTAEIVGTFKA
jgi:hypothetical protein